MEGEKARHATDQVAADLIHLAQQVMRLGKETVLAGPGFVVGRKG